MIHAVIRGKDLLDTIHSNLMSKEQVVRFFGKKAWGKPVWELMPSKLADKAAIENATQTYLGRLVPLSRSIRLTDDCRSLILANGLEYAPFPEWREPTSTVVTRQIKKQPTRVILPASVEKAAWRELHALTVIAVDKNSNGGPAALQNVRMARPLTCGLAVWRPTRRSLWTPPNLSFTSPFKCSMLNETANARMNREYVGRRICLQARPRGLHLSP